MRRVLYFIAFSILSAATAVRGADPQNVRELHIVPASPPDPALKYLLTPQVIDQTAGDAVPLYLSASLALPKNFVSSKTSVDFYTAMDKYLDIPLEELRKSDEAASVANQPGPADLLEQASRREHAGWQTTLRQQGFRTLLPYLDPMRVLACFVELRARLDLANGDIAGALKCAQIHFSMAKHLREEPILVQALVGTGIAEMDLDRVIEPMIQMPGSPNFYWALAHLPRPFFTMRDCLEWERAGALASVTSLHGREADELSPSDWEQVVNDFSSITFGRQDGDPNAKQLERTAWAVLFYPRAKQDLIDHGMAADKVNAMPVMEVLGRDTLRTYDHWLDELGKWCDLPYWQGAEGYRRSEAEFMAAKGRDNINPVFAILPAFNRAYWTLTRLDRHIAALQTVEALRAYAAAHGGEFPQSLEQIVDTPAPIDPTTGKLFVYRVTGEGSAEISSPVPPGGSENQSLHYILKLSSK